MTSQLYLEPPESPRTPAIPAASSYAGSPLRHYLWLIRRRRWHILAAVVICMGLTYGVSRLMTPLYEATASVDIDLRVPSGVLGSEARQPSLLEADQFMATQMKLIQSDSVLRPVVQKYNLLHVEKQDASVLNLPASARAKAPVMLKQLRLNRPPNTYLIQVSYRSPDPELSAQVANEITASYLQHTYELRAQASDGLSDFMARQLEKLKAKMERSSSRLASFDRDLNVADPEQRTAILSSRLVQLNTEYATAQAERLRKEAAFNSVKDGALEAAQISTQGESLHRTMERLREAQEQFALTKSHFAENHPEYKKAALQVRELQSEVEALRENIGKRVEAEFHQAANREAMVAAAVADLKKEFDALNAHSFEYQTLKQEAEADKKVYEELVRKINEATINAGFQNSSIRIADPARPPLRPVSPNLTLNLFLAFCLSFCGAVAWAVASNEQDLAARDPESFWGNNLQVSVLGRLPLVKNSRRAFDESEERAPVTRFLYEEAVGTLRSTIMLSSQDRGLRSIAVTSARPGEGKTLTACHLAMTNARRRRRTLLIDGDFRKPSVHLYCKLERIRGLEEALEGDASWRAFVRNRPGLPDLDILTAGPRSAHSAALLGAFLPRLLAEAAKDYDLIVIDSPPLIGLSEPLEIAAACDGVLLLAVPRETDSAILRHCVNILRQVGVRNLGLVLNKVHAGDSYYGNYSDSYKRYLTSKSA